jgi:alpha-mannosidase
VTLGATLLNDCKYGHQLSDDTLRLTLIRSSSDPDPLPELGAHNLRFAIVPHLGGFPDCAAKAVRQGYAFNHDVITVGTTVHGGDLPAESSSLEVLSPNVMLSGLKRAEDSDAVIVRLYEFSGVATRAEVRIAPTLAPAGASAVETDVLEQPLAENTATFTGDLLTVAIPANGMATVRLG